MDLKEILSIISMFGLAAVGIKQVAELIARPSSFVVKKSRERTKVAVLEALREVETGAFLSSLKEAFQGLIEKENPKLMDSMCYKISIHDEKSQKTFEEILKNLEELKTATQDLVDLQHSYSNIVLKLQELQQLDNEAILRFYEKAFMDIYEAFEDDRKISAEQMYELEQIYNLYVARGGNGHIKKKMVLALKWEIYN